MRVVEVTDPVLPTEPHVSIDPQPGALHVSWTKASDNIGVGGYQLWVGGVKIFQGTDLEATATKLSCSKTYSVSVRALDMISNRSPRDLVSGTTPDCPPNPTDLLVSDITKTTATLSWSDAGGTGTGFDTYLDAVHRASVNSTSYTYTGLNVAPPMCWGWPPMTPRGTSPPTCTCTPPWRPARVAYLECVCITWSADRRPRMLPRPRLFEVGCECEEHLRRGERVTERVMGSVGR